MNERDIQHMTADELRTQIGIAKYGEIEMHWCQNDPEDGSIYEIQSYVKEPQEQPGAFLYPCRIEKYAGGNGYYPLQEWTDRMYNAWELIEEIRENKNLDVTISGMTKFDKHEHWCVTVENYDIDPEERKEIDSYLIAIAYDEDIKLAICRAWLMWKIYWKK